jgi:hypothetical protein
MPFVPLDERVGLIKKAMQLLCLPARTHGRTHARTHVQGSQRGPPRASRRGRHNHPFPLVRPAPSLPLHHPRDQCPWVSWASSFAAATKEPSRTCGKQASGDGWCNNAMCTPMCTLVLPSNAPSTVNPQKCLGRGRKHAKHRPSEK